MNVLLATNGGAAPPGWTVVGHGAGIFSADGPEGRVWLHRLWTWTRGAETWRLFAVHGTRAILQALAALPGVWVRTLKQCADAAAGDEVSARQAWKHWRVDGTLTGAGGPVVVSDLGWTFAGAVDLGADGAMDVTVLRRPAMPVVLLGAAEDYAGGDGTI